MSAEAARLLDQARRIAANLEGECNALELERDALLLRVAELERLIPPGGAA